MVDQLDEMEVVADDSDKARGNEADIVDLYLAMVNNYKKNVKPILHRIIPKLEEKIENNILNTAFHHFVYYLGCNKIVAKQKAGCDILVSADGVNFEVLTRNGFNDIYNHGGRTFIPTDNGLFLGMANPFWGTQLWRLTDGSENPKPEETEKPGTGETEKPGTGETEKPGTGETEKPGSGKSDKSSDSEIAIKPAGSKNNKTARTGDKTQLMTYVIALVISSLLVVLIIRKKI